MAKQAAADKSTPPPPAEPEAEAPIEDESSGIGEIKIGLPAGKKKARTGLGRNMFWIFGESGVGKSTLASQFPGAWFWTTEPGQDWLEIYEPLMVHSWQHFLDQCAWVEENKPTHFPDGEPIQNIVIDTVDLLFKMCSDHVCQGLGIEDPSEMGHGKAWARLNAEFERVFTKIRRWPFGLVPISHARDREFQMRSRKINRTEPDIGKAGFRVLAGLADFIFYAHMDEMPEYDEDGNVTGNIIERRLLQTQPSSSVVAKCRAAVKIPNKIDMSYGSIVEAFNSGTRIPTITGSSGSGKSKAGAGR